MRKSTAIFAAPVSAYAQEITSRIVGSGHWRGADGTPLATITITDTRTGASRSVQTGAEVSFSGENLTIGGAPTRSPLRARIFRASRSRTSSPRCASTSSRAMTATSSSSTAQCANPQLCAVDSGQAFGENVPNNVPSIANGIRHRFEVNRVSCLGGNDGSNTFTVNGHVQAQRVGLNGYTIDRRQAALCRDHTDAGSSDSRAER